MVKSSSGHTQSSEVPKLLILSDGKPGHVNQSIAFARLLDLPFEVRRVYFRNRLCKALSYLFDRAGLSISWLFKAEGDLPQCHAVVSAGSETYYANRVLSRLWGVRSVAIMLPRGYRYGFDLIVAQQHDHPPALDNILTIPVNLSFPEPKGLVSRDGDKPCVSFIIGGSSRHYRMNVAALEKQMQQVFNLFPDADFLVTTSRRTPPEVEAFVDNGPFRYKLIASRQETNPIPDFLAISDYVFVTEDSTSMISEAVCYGKASVEVLTNEDLAQAGKLARYVDLLVDLGCLNKFNGILGSCRRKINLSEPLKLYAERLLWR